MEINTLYASLIAALILCVEFPAMTSAQNNVTDSQGSKKTIHLLGLLPLTSISLPVGHIVGPTVDLALEQINEREDILQDYELKLHWRDTKCAPGPGIDALYHLLFTPPVKTMIVGELCSISCEPIAKASALWNISHMAFGCNTPTLSDRTVFPNFFRAAPAEVAKIPVLLKLMEFFKWTRVAMIHEADEYWSMYSAELHTALDEVNATVISSEIFLGDPSLQVSNLQKHGARILFGGFYEDGALRVLCEAYKIGYYGPNIVWLLFAWLTETFWQTAPLHTDCTAEQVLAVVRKSALYVGVDNDNVDNLNTPTVGQLSRAELYAYMKSLHGPNVTAIKFMNYMYDGIWAAALILNRTVEKMKATGFPRGLDEFTYVDTEMTDLISSSVDGLQFQGILGPLKWTGDNCPVADMFLQQQWGEIRESVGRVTVGEDHIDWNDRGILWDSGRPPRDSEVTIFKVVSVKNSLYVLMCILTSLGIVFSIVLLGFNVSFRNRRVIKMSSPNINNIMLVGCLISYTAIFFNPTKDDVVSPWGSCIATLSTLLVGFSLMFGALFSKTWRIHVIMRSSRKTMKKVIIKDSKLVVIILGLVLVDVSLIILWQALAPFQVVINDGTPEVSSSDPDVWIVSQTTGCHSKYETYFSGVLYGIQGIMLAFGAFLAWETRQVKIAAINDSKEIGMCIYNVLILGVMGVLINLVVDDIDVKYGFTSATIIAATALTQGLIFVPKILSVRRGDDGAAGTSVRVATTGTYDDSDPHSTGGAADATRGTQDGDTSRD